MNSRSGFVAPLAVFALALVLLMLPVALFLVGQPHDTRSKAFEDNSPGVSAVAPAGNIADDVYVDADLPNKSLAGSNALWVDGQSVKIAYLKFDLTHLFGKQITSAKLRLFVTHTATPSQTVYAVADTSWAAPGVTFDSKPAFGSVLATINGGTAGQWVEVDLTQYVKANLGKMAAVGIASNNPNGLGINSTDAAADKPELVLN